MPKVMNFFLTREQVVVYCSNLDHAFVLRMLDTCAKI